MIYVYHCSKCKKDFDVCKRVSEINTSETCSICGSEMKRKFILPKLEIYGHCSTQSAYYHPGLGCVVRDDKHAKKIAKERKLVECGDQKPEKFLKPKVKDYDE